MAWPIILDACVLVPGGLRDDLLSIAATRIYRPAWSSEILDEVARNLQGKFGMTSGQVSHLSAELRRAFPAAEVGGWRARLDWVPASVHEKDRHVVAAAMASEARVIVTANLKHFAVDELRETLDIAVKSPDDFLLDQWTMSPGQAASGVRRQISRLRRTPEEHVEAVSKRLPKFGEVLGVDIRLLHEAD